MAVCDVAHTLATDLSLKGRRRRFCDSQLEPAGPDLLPDFRHNAETLGPIATRA